MKRFLIIAVLSASLSTPAFAQEDDSKSLMEQGAELFFEGLRREMEPALDELLGMADALGPAMQSFLQEMGKEGAKVGVLPFRDQAVFWDTLSQEVDTAREEGHLLACAWDLMNVSLVALEETLAFVLRDVVSHLEKGRVRGGNLIWVCS